MSDALFAGTTVLSPSGQAFTVSDALSAEFEPGDRLIATDLEGLLRIPAKDHDTANTAVTACHKAFNDMGAVTNDQIIDFYHQFAAALANDEIWEQIQSVNKNDVASARRRGRSTTRLVVSDKMRQGMIDGLNGWASMPSQRDAVLETIDHEDFRVELVGAALGLVAFVFEGRPNVLADACGVLRGGNTVVMRIGSDALSTANTIMSAALIPSLVAAGLPQHAVTLVNSPTHASGWALFLDQRLGLAVARGSGPAVAQLGALAQSVGTPVSLHGTGGAWMMASATADPAHFEQVVTRSLDRKVCNTLNTCCIERSAADQLVPAFIAGIHTAGENRGQAYRLHVVEGSEGMVDPALFNETVQVLRAEGPVDEPCATLLSRNDLGIEWEWEESPEVTLMVVDSVEEATRLFNQYSPRLVVSLISSDEVEQTQFWQQVHSPFVGDNHTRWVDGQFALSKPELGLSNWANGRLFGRGAILTGDGVYTVRTRYVQQ